MRRKFHFKSQCYQTTRHRKRLKCCELLFSLASSRCWKFVGRLRARPQADSHTFYYGNMRNVSWLLLFLPTHKLSTVQMSKLFIFLLVFFCVCDNVMKSLLFLLSCCCCTPNVWPQALVHCALHTNQHCLDRKSVRIFGSAGFQVGSQTKKDLVEMLEMWFDAIVNIQM